MSGLSRLLTSLSVQCEVRVRHGMPKGQRVFSTLEDLDAPILLKPWIRMFRRLSPGSILNHMCKSREIYKSGTRPEKATYYSTVSDDARAERIL